MKPKPNRRTIFVVALIWVIAQAPFAVAAQAISTSCNYHAASYSVLLPNSFDLDQNAVMKVRYRETGASAWKEGFPPDRIGESFVGSLFQLQPDTEYELEGVLIDSIPSILQIPLPLTSMRTRAEPNIQATTTIKWVSPNGSGNAYTEAAPGDLKTLLASGMVSCGTTVFLKHGVYHTGEMSLSLTSDCSEASPVNLIAAPG
ncbi:MAG: hypothetical protein JNJ57_15025, partial [Saprospiraceae bacterium]|nr:hypothetical protein [Saprospiraceae bacterium]